MNYSIFEFTKQLLVRTVTIEDFGNAMRKWSKEDPSIEDMLAMCSDSAATLAYEIIENITEGNNLYPNYVITGIYEDERKLNEILNSFAIDMPEKLQRTIERAFKEIDYLISQLPQCKWLNKVEDLIRERLNAIKMSVNIRFSTNEKPKYMFDEVLANVLEKNDVRINKNAPLNNITTAIKEMEKIGDVIGHSDKFSCYPKIKNVDRKGNTIEIEKDSKGNMVAVINQKTSLDQFGVDSLRLELQVLHEFIIDYLATLMKDKAGEYIVNQLQAIKYLIGIVTIKQDSQLSAFKKQLKEMYNDIIGRYEHLLPAFYKKANGLIDDNDTKLAKLTWLGGGVSLATLLYELANRHKTKKGKPVLDATSQEIEDFVCRSFVDGNGESFNSSSIRRYLGGTDKHAKREKIDLPPDTNFDE